MFPTLPQLSAALTRGDTTSRQLVEECLARIEDEAGEGSRSFMYVDDNQARATADAYDALRAAGAPLPPFAGIPISIKDLFDIKGQVTRAGSRVLDDAAPANADAPVVARLRTAGFILIGRTNMTEFAYSGLGLNPHYGTPSSIWDRQNKRIPGGSSSGAAISVADGMAHAALGTDTGGSCRIPAAFNGLTGFKPTAFRVPRQGTVPLSTTLDSIGPIARSVACCTALDSILSGETESHPAPDTRNLRLAIPRTVALDGLDDEVAAQFEAAVHRLSAAGARIIEIEMPEFGEVAGLQAKGGITAAESHAWHRKLIEKDATRYDQRVLARIQRGAEQCAADYLDTIAARDSLIRRATQRLLGFDSLLMPSVAVLPLLVSSLVDDDDYLSANLLVLRNATLINMIDGCAISLPVNEPGAAPVGITLASYHRNDAALLALAEALEPVVTQNG